MQYFNQINLWQRDSSSPTLCSPSELESLLNFQYLSQLTFHPEEKILEKGIDKWKKGEVSEKHLFNGIRFKTEIEQGALAKSSVRWCGDRVGWGLFAEEDLPKDAFVGEYTGMVRKNDDHTSINDYLFRYPIADPIGRDYTIDATSGNLIRFVNHNPYPNLQTHYAFFDGFYHVILLSMETVKKGTQFSYDYGANYWYVRAPPEFM